MKYYSHHKAWLAAHPHRSAEWLDRMIEEGFEVHHLDHDHANDDPANLVLIEGRDHMRLHGSKQKDHRAELREKRGCGQIQELNSRGARTVGKYRSKCAMVGL